MRVSSESSGPVSMLATVGHGEAALGVVTVSAASGNEAPGTSAAGVGTSVGLAAAVALGTVPVPGVVMATGGSTLVTASFWVLAEMGGGVRGGEAGSVHMGLWGRLGTRL